MKRLAEIQKLMTDAIVGPSPESESPVLQLFPKGNSRTPLEQFSVYRRTVRSNLFGALKDSYPACCAVVGENYFKQLAADYFQKFPPAEPDLNHYGDNFEVYLTELIQAREEARSLVYLPELSRLEWHWYLLNFREENFAEELDFQYPVHLIWEMATEDSDSTIDLSDDGVRIRLARLEGKRSIRAENWSLSSGDQKCSRASSSNATTLVD